MSDKSWDKRWKIIDTLGEGGQGRVFRVMTAERLAAQQQGLRQIVRTIELASQTIRDKAGWPKVTEAARKLAQAVDEINRSDRQTELGALKELKIPSGADGTQASSRFEAELAALGALRDNSGVLKVLDSDLAEGWLVTEFHHRGTLESERPSTVGDGLRALKRFRPLVAAVAEIHKLRLVHRDIKPANIFIGDDGRLVLGDFGIVFWADATHSRLTDTFERVGHATGWHRGRTPAGE
jgi:serine/threonine protein kinase